MFKRLVDLLMPGRARKRILAYYDALPCIHADAYRIAYCAGENNDPMPDAQPEVFTLKRDDEMRALSEMRRGYNEAQHLRRQFLLRDAFDAGFNTTARSVMGVSDAARAHIAGKDGNRPAWHNYPASLRRRFAGAGGCNDWGTRMNKRRIASLAAIGALISREIAERLAAYVAPVIVEQFRASYRPIVGPRKRQHVAQWKNEQNRRGRK